ncbi:MAG: vWA domain-containing protein [Actinomycetota bacterium]
MSNRAVAARFGGAAPRRLITALALTLGFALLLVPLGAESSAQTDDETPPALLLILDSSGSMNASDGAGSTKIQGAKAALNGVVDALPEDSLVGLRVYGHRVPNTDKQRGCKDTELIVPVGPLDRGGMKQRIASFDAKGFTPIGLSLRKGAADLPATGDRTIVLVSDGIDTCAPPPPCKVAKKLTKQGVDLRIDTVGFQVDPQARKELQCIARVAEGSYVDANSSAELSDQLAQLSLRALRKFETSGTAVTGGTSTSDAPALESGQFTDSISPGESLYYAVDLAEGQSLGASVATVGEINFLGTLDLTLTNPSQEFVANDAAVSTGESLQSISVVTETIGPAATAPVMQVPGAYHLNLSLDSQGDPAEEYPIEMLVEVTGEPVEPSPTEQPDTRGGGDPSSAAGDDSSSGNTMMLIIGGLAFGLLGAALGAIAGRRLVGTR